MIDENANTADLTIGEKLDRILQRLTALESQGAGTTRPLLDQIIKEMVETRETLNQRLDGMDARLATLEQESKVIRRELGLPREDVS
jgi:phosphopantothenate synthetase